MNVPTTPWGVTSSVRNFIKGGKIAFKPSAPPSVSTGSGTVAVYAPPTVAPPPNAVALVNNQLATSAQLAGNTATGSGTGAGTQSVAQFKSIVGHKGLAILAALGALLFIAFVVDRRS